MKIDTAKSLVSGIVDVNETTINVDIFELPKGVSPKQAMKELSNKAVHLFKTQISNEVCYERRIY